MVTIKSPRTAAPPLTGCHGNQKPAAGGATKKTASAIRYAHPISSIVNFRAKISIGSQLWRQHSTSRNLPVQVDIRTGRRVTTAPQGRPQSLITKRLGGCVAAAIVLEFADGRREASLTHFPPISPEWQKSVLRKLLPHDHQHAVHKRMYIAIKDRRGTTASDDIIAGLCESLGSNVTVTVERYAGRGQLATYHIDVPPSDQGPVTTRLTYETQAVSKMPDALIASWRVFVGQSHPTFS